MTEQNKKIINKDLITEPPPNPMFRVLLNTEDLILDYVSVKIRHSFFNDTTRK